MVHGQQCPGLSVHCQILSLTADTDLSTTPMFIGKLLHGLLSAAISFFIFMSVPEQALDMAAFAPLTSHLYAEPFKTVLYASMLALTACAALTLCLKVKNLLSAEFSLTRGRLKQGRKLKAAFF